MISRRTGLSSMVVGLLVIACAAPVPPIAAPSTPVAPSDQNSVEALPPIVVHQCDWDKPIILSASDVLSDGTAQQIDKHNSDGARFCAWKPLRK